ncbi:MAG: hypothetical protein ACYC99_00580 [Candidatus Geothermincolia bacterium]
MLMLIGICILLILAIIVHEFGHAAGLRLLGFPPTKICFLCDLDWTDETLRGKYRALKWHPMGFEVDIGSHISMYAAFVEDLHYRPELESMSKARQVFQALSGHIAALFFLVIALVPGLVIAIFYNNWSDVVFRLALYTLAIYTVSMLAELFIDRSDLHRIRDIAAGRGPFSYRDRIPVPAPTVTPGDGAHDLGSTESDRAQHPAHSQKLLLKAIWLLTIVSLALGLVGSAAYVFFYVAVRKGNLEAGRLLQIASGWLISFAIIGLFLVAAWAAYGLIRKTVPGSSKKSVWTALVVCCVVFVLLAGGSSYLRITKSGWAWIFPQGPARVVGRQFIWERQYDQIENIHFFRKVAGTDPKHVWAVGSTSSDTVLPILFYDGTKWTGYRMSNSSDNLTSVFVQNTRSVWVTSKDGRLLHFDGTTWAVQTRKGMPPDPDIRFNGVVGNEIGKPFVTAESSYVLSFDGNEWDVERESSQERHYSGIFAGPKHSIFVPTRTTEKSYLLEFNNGTWTEQPKPVPARLSAVDNSHMWGIKADSIMMWNGTSWIQQLKRKSNRMMFADIFAVTIDDVWALATTDLSAGWSVFHYDGSRWEEECTSPTVNARFARNGMWSIYAADSDNVWLAGDGIFKGTRKHD